jgi:hypothetical protein
MWPHDRRAGVLRNERRKLRDSRWIRLLRDPQLREWALPLMPRLVRRRRSPISASNPNSDNDDPRGAATRHPQPALEASLVVSSGEVPSGAALFDEPPLACAPPPAP